MASNKRKQNNRNNAKNIKKTRRVGKKTGNDDESIFNKFLQLRNTDDSKVLNVFRKHYLNKIDIELLINISNISEGS